MLSRRALPATSTDRPVPRTPQATLSCTWDVFHKGVGWWPGGVGVGTLSLTLDGSLRTRLDALSPLIELTGEADREPFPAIAARRQARLTSEGRERHQGRGRVFWLTMTGRAESSAGFRPRTG